MWPVYKVLQGLPADRLARRGHKDEQGRPDLLVPQTGLLVLRAQQGLQSVGKRLLR